MSSNGVVGERLRAFVERVQRLEEEIRVINDDKADIYKEAKGEGFDTKILKMVIRDLRKQPHEREEQAAVYDLYMDALTGGGGV
ncbi:conserved hypothetical protein [Roseibium sp. TrichSKD4]|uniref:DUF2312 domain-containing protein n=1 Tax=Roseibium sp. TrichSKD4 TaxID=744980 RepID=UPI0001E56B0A|nr:DUF2312 domain-containing protein [Roseibium sp. TrichSKD4]EFO32600.1 conserved hypothetical protein [Roseibium sp. TrichSKD4]